MSSASFGRNRPPRIDTGQLNPNPDFGDASFDTTTPHSPRLPQLPSFRLSPSADTQPHHSNTIPKANNKARNESRKLLAHVLGQLQNRTLPPSIFEGFKRDGPAGNDSNIGTLFFVVKGVTTLSPTRHEYGAIPRADADSDDEAEEGFTTDNTLDLMIQLKDVLLISAAQGWHIFDDGPSKQRRAGKSVSPFRRSRNSLQPGNKRSRSPSPVSNSTFHAPELLSQCISVIASVISEDCRYQIASPRPSRPPNALQALTLEISQFILHSHKHDSAIVPQVAFAVLPAFTTFPKEMLPRLLLFYEQGILREALAELRGVQGLRESTDIDAANTGAPRLSVTPVVSIQVETVQDSPSHTSSQDDWIPWPSSEGDVFVQATRSPSQPLALYQLASLVPVLLSATLDRLDLAPDPRIRADITHRFYRLIGLLVDAKVDVYMDLLEVVAYHSPKARRAAITLLITLWPKSIGHLVISQPLPSLPIAGSLTLKPINNASLDHPYSHQFVPWRFVSAKPGGSATLLNCRVCSESIIDFGLLCTSCMYAVHFDCYDYPDGSQVVQYPTASEDAVERVAMYRFSNVLALRKDLGPRTVFKQHHRFRPINLFTLCLCTICHGPLWGCTSQGLKCSFCPHIVHSTCLDRAGESTLPRCGTREMTSQDTDIKWETLRASCLQFFGKVLTLREEELERRSYEELTVLAAVLWTQTQILGGGIVLGSIVVFRGGKNVAESPGLRSVEFELHRLLEWCEIHLSSDRAVSSPAMDGYLQENHLSRSSHIWMFDWPTLSYMATSIKSTYVSQKVTPSISSDLLSVSQPDPFQNIPPEHITHPYESIPLSYLRNALGHEFHICRDDIAGLLLTHFHHLGFFYHLDAQNDDIGYDQTTKGLRCVFPLPLGYDLSTGVEALVSSIESCLADLDLSVNEAGFLLLTRKLWPNGLTSEYALQRLCRTLLSWVLAEADNMAIILRDYIAKKKDLPGVRSTQDPPSWPESKSLRPTPASSNNGGDYLACRRSLRDRYVGAWLLAFHGLDPSFYVSTIFNLVVGMAEDDIGFRESDLEGSKLSAALHDRALHFILKLTTTSAVFSVFDELFIRWLQSVTSLDLIKESIPCLPRVFARDNESSGRFSVNYEAGPMASDPHGTPPLDPWRPVFMTATQSQEGMMEALKWLQVFVCSGVELPDIVLVEFSKLLAKRQSPLLSTIRLVEALLASVWLKSLGRQDLQVVVSVAHSQLSQFIVGSLERGKDMGVLLPFIRQSLGACLLLYGCDRARVLELGLILPGEIDHLPSRRKTNHHASAALDPIIVDPRLMGALEAYINVGVDEVSSLIAKFLNTFMGESPYLESHEVDNFVLRNGRFLSTCAWQFYAIQTPELSSIRTSLLLRTLVVDPQPFQEVFQDWLSESAAWERRLSGVTRLFRIILDVTSPFFIVEDRQWRSNVTDVFRLFFGSIWEEKREEVRLAVETFSATLLPAHFEAITQCWNEQLAVAPVRERVKLISFLSYLRPHFPTWKVLSWDVVIDSLVEDGGQAAELGSSHLARFGIHPSSTPPRKTTIDTDLEALRISTLLLSLQMIANGIVIDSLSLLKLKVHLLRVLGFSNVIAVPSPGTHTFQVQFGDVREVPESALPCFNELHIVLDAPHTIEHPSSAPTSPSDGKLASPLVGSVFVDVWLTLLCTTRDLSSFPVMAMKSILEGLCVVIYKHNFEDRNLKHLQQTLRRAVIRVMDFMLQDICYELRQLALSIGHAFLKRCSMFMGSAVYISLENTAKLIAQHTYQGQDSLISLAKSLIDATLTTYSTNGLFNNLLKRVLDRDFFIVLKQITDANAKTTPAAESLRVILLQDTLPRAAENDQTTFQLVLNNIQTYFDVVFHQNLGADLMQFVGQHLTHIARRTSEWGSDNMDPAPLLHIAALLIQHNKAHSRDMISYVDVVLRVALNRFHVTSASLVRLVNVHASLYRKTQANVSGPNQNGVVVVIYEILSDGLRLKARISPTTLRAMLETIMEIEKPASIAPYTSQLNSILGLVDHSVHFIYNHVWSDSHSEDDFAASLAAARLILFATLHDPTVITKLSDHTLERTSRHNFSVRLWNILALAALQEPSQPWTAIIFSQLSTFSIIHTGVLRSYTFAGSSALENATTDVNHAYIGLKLWLLLTGTQDSNGSQEAYRVWNELWSPFEAFIGVLETEAQAGLSSTLVTMTASTVADLFVFLCSMRSPIVLQTSLHVALLNRLRVITRGDSASAKLARATKGLVDQPAPLASDVMVNQVAKDIIAAEKLRLLESRRDTNKSSQDRKGGPERRRERTANTSNMSS